MKIVKELLEVVKKEKRPTAKENATVGKAAADVTTRLGKALRRSRANAKAVVGGSGAKGTWLRGMHDIDIFLCFNYNKYKGSSDKLSDSLEKVVKAVFKKHERLHGSRDYFRVVNKGYNFELVPILKVRKASQAINITDASLLHTGWVSKQLRKNKKVGLADEIRLAKAFCIAQSVYGAESYVRGFSGYACEILTAYYGSFLKLITAASAKWKKTVAEGGKIVIDAESHYKGRDPARELNEAKVQSELIVIDPVQRDRNATAALSSESLQRFIDAASAFLKRPDKRFFEREEITVEKLLPMAKGKRLVIAEAAPMNGKEDVVGAKLLKAHQHIKQQLMENGFRLVEGGWDWGKNRTGRKAMALMWYVTEKAEPEPEIRAGPPSKNKLHCERFTQLHNGKKDRKLFEKNGRLYVRIERNYKQPQQLIKAIVAEDKYLKDKAKSYRVRSYNDGKNLA